MPQAQVKRQDNNNSNNDEVKGITLKHDEFFRTNLFCPLLMSFILENKCKKKKSTSPLILSIAAAPLSLLTFIHLPIHSLNKTHSQKIYTIQSNNYQEAVEIKIGAYNARHENDDKNETTAHNERDMTPHTYKNYEK